MDDAQLNALSMNKDLEISCNFVQEIDSYRNKDGTSYLIIDCGGVAVRKLLDSIGLETIKQYIAEVE